MYKPLAQETCHAPTIIRRKILKSADDNGMKVAIIHDWLNGMRGGELVLDSLLKVYPSADLFTLFYSPGKLNPRIEQRKITTAFTDHLPFKESKYRWYLPLFPTAIESLDLKGYDLVISSSHCVAKGVITDPDSIHFSYIHSPMRYVWDLYYDYFPSRKGFKFFAFEAISNYLRTWDVASSSRVDWFWSNSEFVARRIRKFYRREAKVIFPPCLPEKWKVISTTKDDFYLIVSAFAPYKRIDLAIETFRKNGKRLVLIGGGQEFKKLTSKLPQNIEVLPQLKREEVLEYYKKAKAFLFPGMEDFGIAPVEAQAHCTPVIAFGKGGALETVVSDKTGVFFQNKPWNPYKLRLIDLTGFPGKLPSFRRM
ncbi:glycosyltransferase, group 1 family protein [Leptospira interrogans serovar Grippotyphosa str. LT2186]|uniref:Glycosyltransferase, group 1 family protein n=1 Tax=Leptospira interrogans serovar Grippotyphosa str. LT2186 TaxID=1001599 RepID=M3G0A2_LEPIR|nr:glycosyltransferase, group 1 family protein [Leptospira interrogans serovar Grippotyphosa str. LT2186]